MSSNFTSKGKCIICGSDVHSSDKHIKSENGICHQRCVLGSSGARA